MKLKLSAYKASKDWRKKYNQVDSHFSKKGMRLTQSKVIVPAGKYFLGDPCYAVPKRLWSDLLISSHYFDSPIGQVAHYKVCAFGTGGDGEFRDQFGNRFPVDAGLIGLVPEGLVDMDEFKKYGAVPGIWVNFDREALCDDDDDILRFGKYRISLFGDNDEE